MEWCEYCVRGVVRNAWRSSRVGKAQGPWRGVEDSSLQGGDPSVGAYLEVTGGGVV